MSLIPGLFTVKISRKAPVNAHSTQSICKGVRWASRKHSTLTSAINAIACCFCLFVVCFFSGCFLGCNKMKAMQEQQEGANS